MVEFRRYESFTGNGDDSGRRAYVISEDKAKRVDFAIKLGKPILVEGEAGCGKTQLAYAIARDLGLEKPIEIPVRSNSRANDMFYRFDALRRLQDSNIKSKQELAEFTHNYITLEPLGNAIVEGLPRVALIDEVDKGDVDFQNDLLFALERFAFPIDEIPRDEADAAKKAKGLSPMMEFQGGYRPIIVFTSNRENQLPKPFLRRCIYLELTFPDEADLIEIVTENLRRRHEDNRSEIASLAELSELVIKRAAAAFLEMRELADKNNAIKKPATVELIDWVHVLHMEKVKGDDIFGAYPPFWDMLFKSAEDQEQHGVAKDK